MLTATAPAGHLLAPLRRSLVAAFLLTLLAKAAVGQGTADAEDFETDITCSILLRGEVGSADQVPTVTDAGIECTGPGTPVTINANPVVVDLLGETVPGASLVAGSPQDAYLTFDSLPPITIRDSEIDDLVGTGQAPVRIESTTMQFLESEFDRNSMADAGVVHASDSTLRFRNCTFRANSGARAGAVVAAGGDVTILNSLFLGNTGTGEGAGPASGAVMASRMATVLIDQSVFRGNQALQPGASAFMATEDVSANISHVDFNMNSALNGSAIVMDGGRIGIFGSVFETNGGGAGGAGVLLERGAAGSILGSEFNENIGDDGALTVRDSAVDVQACFFNLNHGRKFGGAVSIFGGAPGSTQSFTNCIFENNSAPVGAAIAMSITPETRLEECVFLANRAGMLGGALYQWNCDGTEVVGCRFQANSARLAGGAISQTACSGESPEAMSEDRLQLECMAEDGLACTDVRIVRSDFVHNVAHLRGGEVFHKGCKNVELSGNRYQYSQFFATEGRVMFQEACETLTEEDETYEAVELDLEKPLNTVVVRKECPSEGLDGN
eukprot:evm.model.scf_1396EXC.1 EVM.evm.TU.scf_1396EXC.1   scf_1396EXC:14078-15745(+)